MKNDIVESYCSLETSKLLFLRGFQVPVREFWMFSSRKERWNFYTGEEYFNHNRYENFVSCPTHQTAIEWVRLNYDVWIEVIRWKKDAYCAFYDSSYTEDFDTPYQAAEEALTLVLNKVKVK